MLIKNMYLSTRLLKRVGMDGAYFAPLSISHYVINFNILVYTL